MSYQKSEKYKLRDSLRLPYLRCPTAVKHEHSFMSSTLLLYYLVAMRCG
jgi:hypothetical protein